MKRTPLLAAALAAAVTGACYRDDSPTAAATRGPTTTVKLTDAPFPFDSIDRVDIYVVSVAASTEDTIATPGSMHWVTLAEPRRRYNLLDLQQGDTSVLGRSQVPAGQYQSVRVIIDTDSSSLTHRYGGNVQVTWPRNGQLALYALVEAPLPVANVTQENAAANNIVIDFDVGRSFIYWGGTGFTFIPVIRAVNEAATGKLTGTVLADPDGDGTNQPVKNAIISVLRGDPRQGAATWSLAATGHTDAQGHYAVAFLRAGTYIVRIEAPGLFTVGAVTQPDVHVTAGGTTTLSASLPPVNRSYLHIEGAFVVDVGAAATLHALVGDSRGAPVPNPAVTWTSANPAAATVAAAGTGEYATVRGVALGDALITAESNGMRDTVVVHVGPLPPPPPPPSTLPVYSVVINPSASTLTTRTDSLWFGVTLRDSLGTILQNRAVTWTISNSAVAQILSQSNYGATLRGVSPGTATLRATSEGKTGEAAVTVNP
jgi:hypothetical protein